MSQRLDIELGRLEALTRLHVLNSEPEELFDNLTSIASKVFAAPISLISLVSSDTQWFKSCVGLTLASTPRDIAFCDYAIRDDHVLVILDAEKDPRFANNPLVRGEPKIRFYAGAPLTTRDGHKVGTLCVIDKKPRSSFGEDQCSVLELLAGTVMRALELRAERYDGRAGGPLPAA